MFSEKYVITLVPNPDYADNPTYRVIPFSEEGKTNNLKIIGLSKFEFLPTITENDPDYGNTNFYQFKIIHYINDIQQTETIAEIDKDILLSPPVAVIDGAFPVMLFEIVISLTALVTAAGNTINSVPFESAI
jgi:hypothetical protein